MKVKNWSEFQHFKDRRPPWIKLYKYLLDDPDWHELSGDDAKVLIMIWLVASEDKELEGSLPCMKKLAFRLRIKESVLKQTLNRLQNWLIQDDIKPISSRYQDDAPEKRQRRDREETEKSENRSVLFEKIWRNYPRKIGKKKARAYFLKLKDLTDEKVFFILDQLEKQKQSHDWQKENGKYIPHGSTWFVGEKWDDEVGVNLVGQTICSTCKNFCRQGAPDYCHKNPNAKACKNYDGK